MVQKLRPARTLLTMMSFVSADSISSVQLGKPLSVWMVQQVILLIANRFA